MNDIFLPPEKLLIQPVHQVDQLPLLGSGTSRRSSEQNAPDFAMKIYICKINYEIILTRKPLLEKPFHLLYARIHGHLYYPSERDIARVYIRQIEVLRKGLNIIIKLSFKK